MWAKQGSRGVPPNSNEGRKRAIKGRQFFRSVYFECALVAQGVYAVHNGFKVLNSRLCYKIIGGRSIVTEWYNTL